VTNAIRLRIGESSHVDSVLKLEESDGAANIRSPIHHVTVGTELVELTRMLTVSDREKIAYLAERESFLTTREAVLTAKLSEVDDREALLTTKLSEIESLAHVERIEWSKKVAKLELNFRKMEATIKVN